MAALDSDAQSSSSTKENMASKNIGYDSLESSKSYIQAQLMQERILETFPFIIPQRKEWEMAKGLSKLTKPPKIENMMPKQLVS